MGGSRQSSLANAAKNLRNWRKELLAARCAMIGTQHKHDQGSATDEERDAAVQRYTRAELAVKAAVARCERVGVALGNEYGKGAET
jgi:hypothetical protein